MKIGQMGEIFYILLLCVCFTSANEQNFTQNLSQNFTQNLSESVFVDTAPDTASDTAPNLDANSSNGVFADTAPNFEIFHDENATNEQISSALDALLDFARANAERINEEFGEYGERIFTHFIYNSKISRTGKFDFDKISEILKFSPNLNYNEGEFDNPLNIVNSYGCDIGAGLENDENSTKFDSEELFALIDLLVSSGAKPSENDAKMASACDNFDAFAYFLANGAPLGNGVVADITSSEAEFIKDQNITLDYLLKTPPSDLRRIAQSYDFSKFHADKMRFFEESLKYKGINELDKKELEGFIKFSALMDNSLAVQFLLEHGICEKDRQMCAYMKAQAKYFEAEKISDMLSLELKHKF
ncbi:MULTISPECIES: hypothetical protein [unclassified Campylobacter]|uniref:hypothetical protein n=1 Tax=unclassified Campylobacter TaxID=2593542 RepID=UPI0022EA0D75|nr:MULTISPECIES: hypothetical protein [unclassified Campylobacter]MDA3042709.1 hypothetical protein [Campylobacter sp. JMF_09 ED2]MDA3077697.1 hypothetical protein [Campylobacter sp. JMF_06 NA1]